MGDAGKGQRGNRAEQHGLQSHVFLPEENWSEHLLRSRANTH